MTLHRFKDGKQNPSSHSIYIIYVIYTKCLTLMFRWHVEIEVWHIYDYQSAYSCRKTSIFKWSHFKMGFPQFPLQTLTLHRTLVHFILFRFEESLFFFITICFCNIWFSNFQLDYGLTFWLYILVFFFSSLFQFKSEKYSFYLNFWPLWISFLPLHKTHVHSLNTYNWKLCFYR